MTGSAIPAATLVIFREGERGPELLMAERARAMAFAGGALVFPGGRIDPDDISLATLPEYAPADHASARIAAIRETLEEAGLPIGIRPMPDTAAVARIRDGLSEKASFGALLAAEGLRLDLAALVPFARWRPDHALARIFDTMFFLAELPGRSPEPAADQGEITRLSWARPADVLAQADAGRATLIYPTRRNLERLSRFASFADAAADARAHPIRTITPWVEAQDGVDHLCIPDDLGYPVTSEPLGGTRRS